MQEDRGPAEQLAKPFHMITDEVELRRAFLFLLGNAEDYVKPLAEIADRNYAYYRGIEYDREIPKGAIRPRARTRLNKDIVESSLSVVHPQVVRGIPGARIEAVHPDEPAFLGEGVPPAMIPPVNEQSQAQPLTDARIAEIFDDIMNGFWHERKEYVHQSQIVLKALIEGVGFRVFHPYHHPKYGRLVRPYMIRRDQFLGDPSGTDLTTFSDFRYIAIKEEMDAATIQAVWGLRERDYVGSSQARRRDDGDVGLVRKAWVGDGENAEHATRELPTYPVHIMYYNVDVPNIVDYRVGQDPKYIDKNMNMKMMVLVNRTKFANLSKNGSELPDNPWWHGEFPIVAYTHAPLLHAAHGYSIVSKMVGPQDFVNILYNQVAHNAAQRGNSSWLAEKGAVRESSFKKVSMPREVVLVERDALSRGRIQEVPPGDIGSDLVGFMQSEIDYARQIVGDATDALAGRNNTSVRSGRHAQTILEASSTGMAEYIRNLEAGHERAIRLEVESIQQVVDFEHPTIQSEFGLHKIPNIDLALPELIFRITLESKADLPSTTIGAEQNYWANLYDRGLMSPYDYLRLIKVLPRLGDEWIDKVRAASRDAVPGVPYSEMALLQLQQKAEAGAQIEQATSEMEGQLPPGGGGGLEEDAESNDNAGIQRGPIE